MLKDMRSISIDVCDYNNNVMCNIFDSSADISGQASDVYVKTERNGAKELTFKLPSTCFTSEGEEENFRIQFLVADYRLRTVTDKETDWFLISEPKIIHDKAAKTVEVTAQHISSLLKTKNLSLEFSDEEGNNVGTAEQLLTTILDGTGWSVGEVAQFLEDDTGEVKVRSIVASAKTGAFKLISTMCDKFDAKPIYHGDIRTVDIVPMNPFSEVEEGEIPEEVLAGENVIELHYNHNISKIARELNSQNIVTRLYAYGSYGDKTTGLCSLQICEHKEYTFTLSANYSAGQEFLFKDASGAKYYFKTPVAQAKNNTITWSELDPLSKSYVYDNAAKRAYFLYKEPETLTYVELTSSIESVKNRFEYLMDFSYYDKVGLLTDNMKQELATFQRNMPGYIEASTDASTALIAYENELSEVAESNTGFLRLTVQSYSTGSNGELKLNLDKRVYSDGVIYRSDYLEAKRNYFSWYCAEALKDNGDPTSGIGSVVYIIHDTDPQTWEKAYVKYIDDEYKTNEYGLVDSVDPSSITLWLTRSKVPTLKSTDRFYLFCTNSISGRLGVKESEIESLEQTLQNTTKIVTEEHPTYFVWDGDAAPSITAIQNSYGWYYRSYSANMNRGDLYFCFGDAGETSWHPVTVSETMPTVVNGSYYYNLRSCKLYHGELGSWVWYEDTEGKRLANNFSKVIFYCLKHDMIYKGLFDKYIHTPSSNLQPGNYAIQNDFGFYWVFTTDKIVTAGSSLYVDTVRNLVFQTDSTEDVVKPEAKPFDTIDFPITNEFEDISWTQGTLNKETGVEVGSNTLYRSNNITLHPATTYQYNLPAGSFVVCYNSKRRYVEYKSLNTTGTFTLTEDTKYVRFVINKTLTSSNFLRVYDYTNRLFISDKEYRIVSPITTAGTRVGLMYLIKTFADIADTCYLTYYPAYKEAQDAVKQYNDNLTAVLGDLYREGYWQKNEYVAGDESKLYKDALENLVKIAKPEASYSITFLDLYQNKNPGFSINGLTELVEWPDIEITDAAHLIDEDIDVNCWAFIDKIEKCYDKPWLTKIEINTNLSLLGQHSFTDVMAHIAEVANETAAKQTLYQRAASISGSGKLSASKLEGLIQANTTRINGGASNWYTDSKGNIVLESADGQSAMMLTGSGWAVSNRKDEWGDWQWDYAATGSGLNADFIAAGTISGTLIEAGSITTDHINASVGQTLDIGSNRSLLLYATVDGKQPAGGLQTQVSNGDGTYRQVGSGDSYIQIAAKEGNNEAFIDIMTGGKLNLQGSEMNLTAQSTMNLQATSVNVTANSDMTFKSGSSFSIESTGEFLVDSRNFSIKKDSSVEGGYKVTVEGKLTSAEGEIAGFTLKEVDKGLATNRKFMYVNGTDSLTSTASGVYLGTDGVNIGGGRVVYSIANKALRVNAEYISVGKQSSGSGTLIAIDGQAGTIGLVAQSAINIGAASTVNIAAGKAVTIASTGTVYIGNSGSPFTIGSDGSNAYIYNGVTSMTDTAHTGIYVGTNGIRLGKGVFNVDTAGALTATSADIKGKVQAQTGRIGSVDGVGGWIIEQNMIYADNKTVVLNSADSYRFYAGSATASDAAFYIMKDGTIKATKGNVAGWSIDTEKFLSGNKLVGISSTAGTNNTGIAFYAGNATPASAPFRVNHAGALTATSADITGAIKANTGYIGGSSGWVIVANQIYSANKITGLSATEGSNNVAIWAGGDGTATLSNAKFYVTHGGKMVSTEADVSGKIYSTNADVKGTIRATALYIGSNAQTLLAVENNKLVLNANDFAYLGSADSGVYITPAQIKIATTGTFQLTSTNFTVDTTGKISSKAGDIGNWTIGTKILYSGKDNAYYDGSAWVSTYVGLSSDESNEYAIWCGSSTAGNAPFRVRRNGLVYLTKVVDLDEDNNEVIVDLGKYSLGKLQYSTVVSVGSDGTVKLSNGKTFKSAASVTVKSISWSGGALSVKLDNPTETNTAITTISWGWNNGSGDIPGVSSKNIFWIKQTPAVSKFGSWTMLGSTTVTAKESGGWSTDHIKKMIVVNQDDSTLYTTTVDASSVYKDGHYNGGHSVTTDTVSTTDSADKTIKPSEKIKVRALYYGDSSIASTVSSKVVGVDTTGWTEGTFSKTALTLQGTNVSLSIKDSEVNVNVCGNDVHFKRHSKSDTPSGTWYEIVSSGYDLTYAVKPSSTTKYYTIKTSTSYYAAGTSYTTDNSPYYTKS